MLLISKLRETISSVLPIVVIVLILSFTIAPLPLFTLVKFILGSVAVIIGLTLFLIGVDIGISPMGERVGGALTSCKNVAILLSASCAIGFLVTIAEPDIQVFSSQIHDVFNSVNRNSLIFMIAAGVGIFMMIGLLRTILHLPLKIVLFVFYAVVFVTAFVGPRVFLGVSFDSGGATTGPMTVPFILALGVGVNRVVKSASQDSSDTFGLTGITSIGPVLAVLIYAVLIAPALQSDVSPKVSGLSSSKNTCISSKNLCTAKAIFLHNEIPPSNTTFFRSNSSVINDSFYLADLSQSNDSSKNKDTSEAEESLPTLIGHLAKEAAMSITPLVVMLVFFQITLLHLPRTNLARLAMGLVWSYIGLLIFLVGVNAGFMKVGKILGATLGAKAAMGGTLWQSVLVIVAVILGAVVVLAEPAVAVLTSQVESISGGTIKKRFILVFLCIASSGAVGLSILRSILGVPLMNILVVGYGVAMALMIFCPKLFTAIAFDSGGVASGPITSTFVLSFALGATSALSASSGAQDGFGVIALVALAPLIAIQILGIVYTSKQKRS